MTEFKNPKDHEIKAGIIWYYRDDVRQKFNINEADFNNAGVFAPYILIHEDLIKPLRCVNLELQKHNLSIT
jgi:hypothetical protein